MYNNHGPKYHLKIRCTPIDYLLLRNKLLPKLSGKKQQTFITL